MHHAHFDELDTLTLYQILRLRSEVFVVEQQCPYLDLDGHDIEPGTIHVWQAEDGTLSAYLRIVNDGARVRIGRVVVAPSFRGTGLAGRLMEYALALIGGSPAVLSAQAHLTGFYARYGFTASGPEFLDDGIPHVPMDRRP